MKLSYRGHTYSANAVCSSVNTAVQLRYRGVVYYLQNADYKVVQPTVILNYRGVNYCMGTSMCPADLRSPEGDLAIA